MIEVMRMQWLTYNQTDRIQGMARYMNQDGSSYELMTLLMIVAGMLAVILVLKFIADHNQRKREKALRARMAKRQSAQKKQPVTGASRRVVQRAR